MEAAMDRVEEHSLCLDGLRHAAVFRRIADAHTRQRVIDLAEELAPDHDVDGALVEASARPKRWR